MSSRKRKRAPTEEEEVEEAPVNEAQARALTQQDLWDSFRETHYETLEQLPLTIHRQLSLMKQLDEQVQTYSARILPMLYEYIEKRKALAPPPKESPAKPADGETPSSARAPSVVSHDSLNPKAPNGSTGNQTVVSRSTSAPLTTPVELSKHPKRRQELLGHIAWLSEEITHVSQEKVNLAMATHDSVERHIRIIEQAIKEQEDLLAKGASSTAIHLPELVVPTGRGPNRANARAAIIPIETDEETHPLGTSTTKDGHLSKKKAKQKTIVGAGYDTDNNKDSGPLTITLPATQPYEELYCYCNRISFGEMIACDGENCEREWFHLGCVGLLKPPEGNWYCEDCRSEDT